MLTRPIWVDIENPPQVQYLAPFVSAFEDRGRPVIVTARDAGITTQLLSSRQIAFKAVGTIPPASRTRKLAAVLARAAALYTFIRRQRPAAVLCSSRPAAIAARAAHLPAFVICDYEHAELGIARQTGATIVHPEVVPAERFAALGFPSNRLIAFEGLKEDISFAELDLDGTPAHDFNVPADGAQRMLIRPPAEISHYFTARSRDLILALYDHLASCDDALTIFSPRYPRQIADLERLHWKRPPIVIREAIPFLSLLKGVDRVVSAGGTMLREAAYLGKPAFSVFGGALGAVDAYLERTGRLTVLRSEQELDRVTESTPPPPPFPRRPEVLGELVDAVLARALASQSPRSL